LSVNGLRTTHAYLIPAMMAIIKWSRKSSTVKRIRYRKLSHLP
jgi:hypothetical protein